MSHTSSSNRACDEAQLQICLGLEARVRQTSHASTGNAWVEVAWSIDVISASRWSLKCGNVVTAWGSSSLPPPRDCPFSRSKHHSSTAKQYLAPRASPKRCQCQLVVVSCRNREAFHGTQSRKLLLTQIDRPVGYSLFTNLSWILLAHSKTGRK